MGDPQEFHEQAARIEGLVEKLESSADPATRATSRELVQCLMDLHGGGIARILEIVSRAESGVRLVQSLGHDELVSSLLVLYNLHPEDFETRVKRGFDKARPKLLARGASLEILALDEALVHVRVVGGAGGEELQTLVRNALFETAPDAANVVIEGGRQQAQGFVPLASLAGVNGAPALAGSVLP